MSVSTGCQRLSIPNFSAEDDLIMREIFMKEDGNTAILEEDHGFQLILHERDFMPGVPITSNMEEAVTQTRRMIMLLSRYLNVCCLNSPSGTDTL